MRPVTDIALDYAFLVADRNTRIASARLMATCAVNSQLVGVYRGIGAAIREKQASTRLGPQCCRPTVK